MNDNPVNLKGLETIYSFSKKNKQSLPPVEKWNPPFCGDIDMKILRHGKWFYMGSEIKRPAMVKLFSSILRLDEDACYYLVTPVEKVRIQVEDAPFVAVSLNKVEISSKTGYLFKTNLNEEILLSKENPLTIKIGENGFLFKDNNELIEKIEKAMNLNSSEKDKIVISALEKIEKSYSIMQMYLSINKAYN